MTREELKNIKIRQKLYVPIITKHYGHNVGNQTIGSNDYCFCELFHLKVEDIRIFDYNEHIRECGREDVLLEIEKKITEANQKRKEKEEKGEFDMKEHKGTLPLTPWWYGTKTILLKFDLSELDTKTKALFNDTYRNYVPSFFSDTAYVYSEKKYCDYLSFKLSEDGVDVNDEIFECSYAGNALSSFSKSKKEAEKIAKRINRKSLKYIDDEIQYFKEIKVKVLEKIKEDNILLGKIKKENVLI